MTPGVDSRIFHKKKNLGSTTIITHGLHQPGLLKAMATDFFSAAILAAKILETFFNRCQEKTGGIYILWISLHELMVTCGCTVLDSDSPCLAAQGWDSIDPTLLRTQPEKVAHVFGIGSELRVLLLELELPQLFSSHW